MTTEEQAIKRLSKYTSYYHPLAIAQYNLARQQGKSVDESLDTVVDKIIEITTAVIDSQQHN